MLDSVGFASNVFWNDFITNSDVVDLDAWDITFCAMILFGV